MTTTPALNHAMTELASDVPAFSQLTERQQRFIIALLQYGAGKGKRSMCARAAGYEGDDATIAVTAHRLFHDKKVQAALRQVASTELISTSLMAIETIRSLAENSTDEKVKLKAAIELADRTGFAVEQVINVKHEDVNKSAADTLEQMVIICLRKPEYIDMIPEPRRTLVRAKVDERLGRLPVIEATMIEARDPDADLLGE